MGNDELIRVSLIKSNGLQLAAEKYSDAMRDGSLKEKIEAAATLKLFINNLLVDAKYQQLTT